MTANTYNKTRSLIVVSRDHGELGFAMSFLRGQAFGSRAAIMLPDNLYANNTVSFLREQGFASRDAIMLPDDRGASNRVSPPVPAFQYRTLQHILGVVDTHKPELVFLFSGYLFTHQDGLLSRESLDALLRHLRERGCRVATSDPFLGLAPQLTLAQIDTRMGTSGQPTLQRWLMRLVLRMRGPKTKVVRVPGFEQVTHLYPTSIPDCQDHVPRLSFFNPTAIRAPTDSGVVGDGRDDGEPHDPRPRWLFLLSVTDLHVQRELVGLREFIERLLGMLRYAAEYNRLPTLIAPASIVTQLASAVPASVELLPLCPFAEFEMRVLDAEYVFYWNAFSFSLLARVANELPVFLFDRGHLARTIKPYYEVARSCHFGGWEPTYLDQRQLFSPYVLAHLAEAQKPAMRALRERWQSSPTPDELVDKLMGAGVEPARA